MIGVCVWCADIARHEANLRQFAEAGLVSGHPLVERSRRRLLWAQRIDGRKHHDSTELVPQVADLCRQCGRGDGFHHWWCRR